MILYPRKIKLLKYLIKPNSYIKRKFNPELKKGTYCVYEREQLSLFIDGKLIKKGNRNSILTDEVIYSIRKYLKYTYINDNICILTLKKDFNINNLLKKGGKK